MLNIDCLCSTCQVCQMTKKERECKKYGLLPPKIAEYDTQSLGHGLCGFGGSIYSKDTIQNTLSAYTHNDRTSNTTQIGLKLLKSQISQQHPSRICFITPDCHVISNLNLLSLTMGQQEYSKRELKQICMQENYGIKAKPTTSHNSQPTTHKQMQSLSEYTKLSMICSDHLTWKTIMKI
jgi:hypothetical protein